MTPKDVKRLDHRGRDMRATGNVRLRPPSILLRSAFAGSLAVTLAAAVQPPAYAQTVSDRFLSRVTAQENGSCATVSIDFNVPIRYTSHFPDRGGRELRIGVQPLNFNRGSLSTALATESLRPPVSAVAGIQRIQYDVSDPAGPTLVIQFDHDANWEVKADKTVTRLVVTVSSRDGCAPRDGSKSADGAPNIIQAVTQSIPSALEPNGNYAINLLSNRGKDVPADELKQIDAFKRFAAYAYTAEENGVEWTRLRLGTFATRAEAEQILTQVAADYPEAWIARIDRAERERVYQAWLAARSGASAVPTALPVDAVSDGMLQELRDKLATGDNAEAVRSGRATAWPARELCDPRSSGVVGSCARTQRPAGAREGRV